VDNCFVLGTYSRVVAIEVPHVPGGAPEPAWFSLRELQVLALVAEGRSNREIGDALALSPLTIKAHLARIGRKLDSGDRAHMVALAMRAGLIT
jgi:DNA-binding CsgD family transcriptional regulator